MLVCHVSRQKEVEDQADNASLAYTFPARQSELQTRHEDVAEMKEWSTAELVPEDDCVRAEGQWHSTDVDGQAQ